MWKFTKRFFSVLGLIFIGLLGVLAAHIKREVQTGLQSSIEAEPDDDEPDDYHYTQGQGSSGGFHGGFHR